MDTDKDTGDQANADVWRGMTQAELDAAYDQQAYAPNMQEVVARYAVASEAVRKRLGPPRRMPYGPSEIEALDWFAAPAPSHGTAGAPINVFIHGGAWRSGSAAQYSFPAGLFVPAGAHCVVPDFIDVVTAGGDLMPLFEQVQRAVAWVARNAATMGADPSRLYLSAHSSGAHLAACVMQTDWAGLFGLPADLVKGAVLCGGMYDIAAPLLSARGGYVKAGLDVQHRLSPQRHLHVPSSFAPCCVVYGALETPEFQRQSVEFAARLRECGGAVELVVGAGLNHFEVLESLGEEGGLLGGLALSQMGLSVGR